MSDTAGLIEEERCRPSSYRLSAGTANS